MLLDEELYESRDFTLLHLAGTVDVGGSHRATKHINTLKVGVLMPIEGKLQDNLLHRLSYVK